MKELVYRDILGNNPRKREVSIEEISKETKAKVAKKWICKYFVKEKYSSQNKHNLRAWLRLKKREQVRKDCHILREVDTRTGENKIICKVLGDFFVISGMTGYKIVYVNEIRIKVDGARIE